MSRIHFVIFRANFKRIYNCQANRKGNDNKKYLFNPGGKKKKKPGKKKKKKINMWQTGKKSKM